MTLAESHARFDAIVHAYCLMGNHYHLLIETPRANLDRIMRHINGVYTQRYNRRKRTDGPLFRGRYKAILIDEDAYLLEVGRYIHRNPAEVKGANDNALSSYRWSSYPSYINETAAPDWLHREKSYQMLAHKNRYVGYRDFVLQGNGADTDKFYGKGNTGSIFGDKLFRQAILEKKETLRVVGDLAHALSERPTMASIVKAVAVVYGTEKHAIVHKAKGRAKRNVARQMAMYCSQELGDHSLAQIASYFCLTNVGSASAAIYAVRNGLRTEEHRVEFDEIVAML